GRSPARRAARAARRAHRRAACAQPAAGLGRQSRTRRPRAPVAEGVPRGARLCGARPAGPTGEAQAHRVTNRTTAVLVAVAVVAGGTVAGVGLATRSSGKPARVLQIDERRGRVGSAVIGETRANVIAVLGRPVADES